MIDIQENQNDEVFDVASQALSTQEWLEEYKETITPSNARKLDNRLKRNKDKCPEAGYELIYFDGEKNISLFAKDVITDDAEICVSAAGFYGLSLGFCHTFDNLHSAVFFFYNIKQYWEAEIEYEQEERDRAKTLSSTQIRTGSRFEGDFIVMDTWGNFVVNIKNTKTGELLSKRLTLINDKLFIEHEGKYLKLL